MKAEDVIIIGAGPAGLAAAIQLKRYGIHPLIFERSRVGGLLHNANLVENYPGFPRGITGPRLVELMVHQARNLDIQVTHAQVTSLAFESSLFQVTAGKKSFQARVVVIATGTSPLGLPNLDLPGELAGRIFYEVVDLLDVEGKSILIVGGGDAAFDYALNLAGKNRVTILNRASSTRCLPLLWDRAKNVSSITYLDNIEICALHPGEQGGILVDCQSEAGALQFYADYLIIAIGRRAQLDIIPDSFRQQAGALEERGVLHIIGDVKNGIYRQTSIAVGEGVMAAMKIYRYLKETA